MRVLVVEDEVRLADNLAAALREGPGFAVDCAEDGEIGQQLAEQGCYDLIVLDLMLPKIDGLTLLRHLRARADATPVLILTAKDGTASTIELLNAGADDYLSKPFDLGELIARAKALIRRGKGASHPVLAVADIEVNTLEQTVRRAGRLIDLSPTEYRILEYMVHRPRVIVSKRELLEHLYDYNWEHHSNVIEAHISNLRKKLTVGRGQGIPVQQAVETLRGRGYRLVADPESAGRNAVLFRAGLSRPCCWSSLSLRLPSLLLRQAMSAIRNCVPSTSCCRVALIHCWAPCKTRKIPLTM